MNTKNLKSKKFTPVLQKTKLSDEEEEVAQQQDYFMGTPNQDDEDNT